jgi:hypothetical protein
MKNHAGTDLSAHALIFCNGLPTCLYFPHVIFITERRIYWNSHCRWRVEDWRSSLQLFVRLCEPHVSEHWIKQSPAFFKFKYVGRSLIFSLIGICDVLTQRLTEMSTRNISFGGGGGGGNTGGA